ncbi:MAG: MGMT family protein [Lewinellaceae bacterium]|nr:MGMT family protein [Saprospiraceae bacterium]MCB9270600.1 MGMT family protein [Lewinellaceae bacterium]HQU53085.1 MGMT family protein [Saprospiraceae bacterium]
MFTDPPSSPSYYELVYEVTKNIPFGRVSTYGAIADYLALGSARMVGWALHQCGNLGDGVPAHRVVNRKGELSGRVHFRTPTLMQELLEAEGVVVVDDKIKDFKEIYWHPQEMEE